MKTVLVFYLASVGLACAQETFVIPKPGSTNAPPAGSTGSPALATVSPAPVAPAAKEQFYSGRVKITKCTDSAAYGVDIKSGQNVTVMPRFKGAHPGLLVDFKGNSIIKMSPTSVTIKPEERLADRSKYTYTGATDATLNVLKTVNGVLQSLNGL